MSLDSAVWLREERERSSPREEAEVVQKITKEKGIKRGIRHIIHVHVTTDDTLHVQQTYVPRHVPCMYFSPPLQSKLQE